MSFEELEPSYVTPSLSMVFSPAAWNAPEVVRNTKCLAYALNDRLLGHSYIPEIYNLDLDRDSIFSYAHHQSTNLIFRYERTQLGDLQILEGAGFERIAPHQYTPDRRHIVAYSREHEHFMRMDRDGTWSHKLGSHPCARTDVKGSTLTSLEGAFMSAHERLSADDIHYFALPVQGIYVVPVLRHDF